MKKTSILGLGAFLLVFLSFGPAFSGTGGPAYTGSCPTNPDDYPEPTSGPYLRGEFTVSNVVVTDEYGGIYVRNAVHIVLHEANAAGNVILPIGDVHLFHYQDITNSSTDLCEVDAETYKTLLAAAPCILGAGSAFGLVGIPVIASLEITAMECDTEGAPLDSMIYGEIVIRVVPEE